MCTVRSAAGKCDGRIEFGRQVPLSPAAGKIVYRERSARNVERLLRVKLSHALGTAGNRDGSATSCFGALPSRTCGCQAWDSWRHTPGAAAPGHSRSSRCSRDYRYSSLRWFPNRRYRRSSKVPGPESLGRIQCFHSRRRSRSGIGIPTLDCLYRYGRCRSARTPMVSPPGRCWRSLWCKAGPTHHMDRDNYRRRTGSPLMRSPAGRASHW